ncbi:PucR family transcriptional regulator ligand-binding domain-containing protein [Bacillus sp. APMAM]|nr:PucR family transcriptional regulator ligand-binding domain-containing protein [Bacillus sp. APMAM]RTZ54330.1 PucR family transcriptional regulator [Bacillus sp. SAJ1]
MATVKDLQLALMEDGITLIAGQEGVDRVIDYITVQEFSLKSSRIHKNGFILTTLNGFKNTEEFMEQFEWYVSTEVSGIGYHSVINQIIPQELIDFANKVNIPLFYIPKNIPYHFISEKFNQLIFQETTRLKNRIEKLNQDMLETLVLEKDIHFIIQSVSKYLQAPIIYLNKEMETLSLWSAGDFSRSDLQNWLVCFLLNYSDLLMKARVSNEYVKEYNLHKIDKNDSVTIIPLSNRISFYGYLLIVNQKEAIPFQEMILKNAITALILDSIKKNQTREFQKSKDIKQFEEIFFHKRVEEFKVEDFYYDVKRLHSIIIVESEDMSALKQNYQVVQKYIEEVDHHALVWIMDRRIIALLHMGFNCSFPEELKVKVGISGNLQEVTNESIQMLYEQAAISLHYSFIKETRLCKWDELGIDKIIFQMHKSTLLKNFYMEYIHELIEYDKNYQTDLVKTLYVYLTTFFSLKESGTKLHIHPNTVKYRIKKIHEIISLNIEDSTQYISLLLSLKSYFYNLQLKTLETKVLNE